MSGVVPATALYFGGYESGKRLMPANYGILGDMLVGCYTQAIAGIVFTPVDIIKERMQVRYCPTCTPLCAVDAPEPHTPCCTCCHAHQGMTQTLHLHLSKGLSSSLKHTSQDSMDRKLDIQVNRIMYCATKHAPEKGCAARQGLSASWCTTSRGVSGLYRCKG